jgi:hypothetical protein
MDRDALRDAVRFNLRNVKIPKISNAQIERWINQTYEGVCDPKVFRHTELEATVAIPMVTGTRTYALTEAALAGYTVSVTYARTVTAVRSAIFLDSTTATVAANDRTQSLRPMDIQQRQGSAQYQGEPGGYDLHGKNFTINSFPTATENGKYLVLEVYVSPIRLALGADTTVLDAEWDEIIETGATARGFRKMNKHDEALTWNGEMARMIADRSEIVDLEGENRQRRITIMSQDSMPYG